MLFHELALGVDGMFFLFWDEMNFLLKTPFFLFKPFFPAVFCKPLKNTTKKTFVATAEPNTWGFNSMLTGYPSKLSEQSTL